MNQMRTYSELASLKTFEERFNYLILDGIIGEETFGWDRCLNQSFYNSSEWKRVRNEVIVRDNGCDLGCDGFPIGGRIIVHHLNPITADILRRKDSMLIDPEYLICVSHDTHNAITYHDTKYLERFRPLTNRTKYDTCPWRV